MPSRSPARQSWRERSWCSACRSYYSASAPCRCAWPWGGQKGGKGVAAWHSQNGEKGTAAWHSQTQSQLSSAGAASTAPWAGSQARTRSTSSGRRRERSLSRQRKHSAAALGGTWEQREALEKLRAAARACSDAGDADGAAAVEAQVDAAMEAMYDALPMAARIAHWEQRRSTQSSFVDRLGELVTLQTTKLATSKAKLRAAQDDLATHERKLAELAAEQAQWGPIANLATANSYGADSTWDNYAWDYTNMGWKWQDTAMPVAAALPPPPPAPPRHVVTDPYLQADLELKDNLLVLLRQVHEHAPTSPAWALAEGIQKQATRQAAQGAGVKSEAGSAAPSPTASQASTMPYSQSPAQHPFRVPTAEVPTENAAPTSAPSLHARAKSTPRPAQRLTQAKRGGRAVQRRVGVASPARSATSVVDIHKVRIGAAEVLIIDDDDAGEEGGALDYMDADGEEGAAALADEPTAARAAAFPQAAEEAAAARA